MKLCPTDINEKSKSIDLDFLAGAEGLEPSRTVLETGMLPLHYAPILTKKSGGPTGTRTPDQPVMSRLL